MYIGGVEQLGDCYKQSHMSFFLYDYKYCLLLDSDFQGVSA